MCKTTFRSSSSFHSLYRSMFFSSSSFYAQVMMTTDVYDIWPVFSMWTSVSVFTTFRIGGRSVFTTLSHSPYYI